MYDTSKAEQVMYRLKHIGYVLQHTKDLYLPLDLKGNNYGGPTSKKDAEDVVVLFHTDRERKAAHEAMHA